MIKINCDIGERGPDHPIDVALMGHIDIANIACGGHAGDRASVKAFRHLAVHNNVAVAGHLSYPDRENFGRCSMDIDMGDLLASLDGQYQMMPDIKMIKFHGALYNDSCADPALSKGLSVWLQKNGITCIITPADSALARYCGESGIQVLAEAFAERRYDYSVETGRLSLVKRSKSYACIHDCGKAVAHTTQIITNGSVDAIVESPDGSTGIRTVAIAADTVCIHSDSHIALELAEKLAVLCREKDAG
jgi:UPF0271 protein